MPGYLIATVKVTDLGRYAAYTAVTPGLIAKFGGRFIVRGGKTIPLEGEWEPGRLVIIEFPTLQEAERFYHSSEYQEARLLRRDAAVGQFIAVDGVPDSSRPAPPS